MGVLRAEEYHPVLIRRGLQNLSPGLVSPHKLARSPVNGVHPSIAAAGINDAANHQWAGLKSSVGGKCPKALSGAGVERVKPAIQAADIHAPTLVGRQGKELTLAPTGNRIGGRVTPVRCLNRQVEN